MYRNYPISIKGIGDVSILNDVFNNARDTLLYLRVQHCTPAYAGYYYCVLITR